jgi:hypothetical protein
MQERFGTSITQLLFHEGLPRLSAMMPYYGIGSESQAMVFTL